MSKILIEGNKVIIDGHANDLETCNTLTNLCDELSKSEKFRTVKYESGYGEFESVSENEEKKFPIELPDIPLPPDPGYKVNIQSNDGSTILAQNATISSVVVTSAGAQLKYEDTVNATYTYSGSKLFAGLATSANALVAEYKPGDTIEITAATTFYIVENIIIPEHHSSLTELFTNIAAVIREKTGDTASIVANDFPAVILERLQVIPQVTLISFTIDGTTYQAQEGMTWGEWVDSEYSSSVQNFQCPSCGVTEYFGKHNFHFTSSSYKIGIGWVAPSAGCEASIYTNEFDVPEPVLSDLSITAGANYTIRTFCND